MPCNRCLARENLPLPRDEWFLFDPDWLGKKRVCSDWLQQVAPVRYHGNSS